MNWKDWQGRAKALALSPVRDGAEGMVAERGHDQACFEDSCPAGRGQGSFTVSLSFVTTAGCRLCARRGAGRPECAGSGDGGWSEECRQGSVHARQVGLSFQAGSQGAPFRGSDIQKLKGILPEPMSSTRGPGLGMDHLSKRKPQGCCHGSQSLPQGEQPPQWAELRVLGPLFHGSRTPGPLREVGQQGVDDQLADPVLRAEPSPVGHFHAGSLLITCSL